MIECIIALVILLSVSSEQIIEQNPFMLTESEVQSTLELNAERLLIVESRAEQVDEFETVIILSRSKFDVVTSRFMILMTPGLYNAIGEDLMNQWVDNILSEGYYDAVSIVEMSSNTSTETIRNYLSDNHQNNNLKGVVLVGDIPAVYCEAMNYNVPDPPLYVLYPSDYYYMDLNSQWTDSYHPNAAGDEFVHGSNGIYESWNQSWSYYQPEIHVGRLTSANVGCIRYSYDYYSDEVMLLQDYLIRNHRHRSKSIPAYTDQAISYFDDYYTPYWYWWTSPLYELYDYSEVDVYSDGNHNGYMNALENNPSCWLWTHAHSGPRIHYWDNSCTFFKDLTPPSPETEGFIRFVVLFCCSGAAFDTEDGCMGQAYLFNLGYNGVTKGALGVVGMTCPSCGLTGPDYAGSQNCADYYFGAISIGENLGQAFQTWANSSTYYYHAIHNQFWRLTSEILLGDPSLYPGLTQ